MSKLSRTAGHALAIIGEAGTPALPLVGAPAAGPKISGPHGSRPPSGGGTSTIRSLGADRSDTSPTLVIAAFAEPMHEE